MEGSVGGTLWEAEGLTFHPLVFDPRANVSYWRIFFTFLIRFQESSLVSRRKEQKLLRYVPLRLKTTFFLSLLFQPSLTFCGDGCLIISTIITRIVLVLTSQPVTDNSHLPV